MVAVVWELVVAVAAAVCVAVAVAAHLLHLLEEEQLMLLRAPVALHPPRAALARLHVVDVVRHQVRLERTRALVHRDRREERHVDVGLGEGHDARLASVEEQERLGLEHLRLVHRLRVLVGDAEPLLLQVQVAHLEGTRSGRALWALSVPLREPRIYNARGMQMGHS